MKRPLDLGFRLLSVLCGLLFAVFGSRGSSAEPPATALVAFNRYVTRVEARLGEQHRSHGGLLADTGPERLQDPVIQRLTSAHDEDVPGGLLQSWRGTAFVPGARAADFERLLRDFRGYPRYFSPEVLRGDAVRIDGDRLQAALRLRQKHVLDGCYGREL